MRKRIPVLIVSLFVLFSILPVHAQAIVCKPDLTNVNDLLTTAQSAIESDDSEATLNAISAARLELQLIEASCLDYAPDEAGNSRTNPVPFGQRQTVEIAGDYTTTIQILRYVENANEMAVEADEDNLPTDGKRYVIIELSYYCDEVPTDSCEFHRTYFGLVGDKGVVYESESLRGVENVEELFGGSEATVVISYLVDADESGFVFFNLFDDEDRVYFATE